jgi:hypothetical protein
MSAARTSAQTAALEALIEAHATDLKLPTVKARFRAMAAEATREQQTPTAYLAALRLVAWPGEGGRGSRGPPRSCRTPRLVGCRSRDPATEHEIARSTGRRSLGAAEARRLAEWEAVAADRCYAGRSGDQSPTRPHRARAARRSPRTSRRLDRPCRRERTWPLSIAARLEPAGDRALLDAPAAATLGELGGIQVSRMDRSHHGLRAELDELRHLLDGENLQIGHRAPH